MKWANFLLTFNKGHILQHFSIIPLESISFMDLSLFLSSLYPPTAIRSWLWELREKKSHNTLINFNYRWKTKANQNPLSLGNKTNTQIKLNFNSHKFSWQKGRTTICVLKGSEWHAISKFVYVPLEKSLLIWRRYHCRWRAAIRP